MSSGIDTQYPYSSASSRGWGPGWPSCSESKWVTAPHGIQWEVREEIAELLDLLISESERRGYIKLHDGWCWGADCRPIKNSDGSLSDTPSNHSWGLAVDLNAPENPYGGNSWAIPGAMGKLWNDYGWGWGGDYPSVKDPMHFEFTGTPAQARDMTERARANLGGDLNDNEHDWLKALYDDMKELRAEIGANAQGDNHDWWRGWRAAYAGDDKPGDEWAALGWQAAHDLMSAAQSARDAQGHAH